MQQRSAILLAALAVGCADRAAESDTDTIAALTAAETQVGQQLAAMGTATQSGDMNGLLALWAPDVRIIETQVLMDGEAQARQMMEGFFGGFTVADLKLTALETIAHDSGNVVYQFGYLTQTLTSKELNQSLPVRNNFALRWIKDASGAWQMHRFIATAAPKEPPNPAPVNITRTTGEIVEHSAAESQIAQRLGEYQGAVNSGDVPRIGGFFAEDVQYYAPEVQHMGKVQLASYLTEVLTAYRFEGQSMLPMETFVHDNGNVAYQYGSYTQNVIEKTGQQAPLITRNNYVARWRRGAEGVWVMDRFLATPQPPLEEPR